MGAELNERGLTFRCDVTQSMLTPQLNRGNYTDPNTSYGGSGGGATGRTQRPNSHGHSYLEVPQPSPLRGSIQGSPSPPAGSSSRNLFDGSDYETSPGAESDCYHSFPNTPADTGGVMPQELDVSRPDALLPLRP